MAWNECLKIQAKINELAFDTFKEHKGYEDFSMPLIPRISPQYLENRFVLLGQETNMWYGHISKIKETDSNFLKIATIVFVGITLKNKGVLSGSFQEPSTKKEYCRDL